MRLTELLSELHNRDIRLFVEEGRLRCEAPRDALTQDLRSAIAIHNKEIHALLTPKRPDGPKIERVPRGGPLPLSFAQQRLWFLSQLDPESSAYNIPAALRLRGHLDVDALARSFNEMVKRHEVLRTTYRLDGVQEIQPDAEFEIPIDDLSGLSREAALEEAYRIALEDAQKPFSLEVAPLLRVRFIEFPRAGDLPEHILIIVLHHIVTDDWSSALFFRELATIYAALSRGAPAPLPEPLLQYADFAVAQREWISGEKLEEDLSYWRKKLANNVPALNLPMRRAPDGARRRAGAERHFEIPESVQHDIRSLSERFGYTRFVYFLSVFYTLLFRYTGQNDISIGTPIANRHIPDVEEMMGFFVNTLVLRADLAGNHLFSDLLAQVQTISLEAQAHQDLPFERLVEALGAQVRDGGQTPLFRIAFVFHNIGFEEPNIPGFEVEPLKGIKRNAVFDLVLHITENEHGLTGWLEYDPDIIDDSTAAQIVRCYLTLLLATAAKPDTLLSQLPLLDAQDARGAPNTRIAAPKRAYPADSIPHLFEIQAAARPEAPAVICSDIELSYSELNARANRLAHRLIALGVKPECLVGVCVDRSVETIVAILAVLKAGGAYVPLDPDYPYERLAYMIADAEPVLVLTKESLRAHLPATATTLCLDSDPSIDCESNLDPPSRTQAANLAYVIYTSGSTGKPKGVAVTHGNVLRLFEATDEAFAFSNRDVWTLFHSYAFDFSVWEIWGALLYGGKLVVVPHWVTRSSQAFHDLLASESITVLNQTPSSFYQLDVTDAARGGSRLPTLRLIIFGGEALETRRLTDWFERYGDDRPQLINMYGITETTVHVTLHRVRAGEGNGIGVPIDDLQAHILDRHMNFTPSGVSGELFIGGTGLARGYLRRPSLTAERFVPDPFSQDGERLYRTGDLGRLREDGDIDYLGRIDHQVKIRGFRIELGEIEAAIAQLDWVREAVVLARKNASGDQQLVAYIVASVDQTAGALREALERDLPDYMIPSRFVFMESFPLTGNGKVDRANLPSPDDSDQLLADYVPPRTPREDVICRIWSETLNLPRVGIRDNFFELGGHSLLAMTLIERMRQKGVDTDVRTLFTKPTVEELAKATANDDRVAIPDYRIPEDCSAIQAEMLPLARLSQAEVNRIVATTPGGAANVQDIYPLAPLQEGILFHHLATEGGGDPYLIPTVLALDSRARVDAFCDALRSVVERHDILRTSIVWEGIREPMQVVWRNAPLTIEEIEIDPSCGDVAQLMIDRYSPRNYRLDVRQAPMVRLFLARDAAHDRWILALLNHHLVDDVSSLRFVFQEIAARLSPHPSPLPEAVPFRNFVAQARLGVAKEDHEAFFKEMLADVSEPTVPYGLTDVQSDGWSAKEARLDLRPEVSARIRAAARTLGVSPASLCHQAFAQLLARVSGKSDVVFGTVLFGRLHAAEGSESAIGIFINTLPIRIRLGLESVSASVRKTHNSLTELLRHEHASLALAQRCSQVVAPAPLFSALLNYRHAVTEQQARDGALALPGVTELYSEERSNFPFDVSVDDFGDGFRLTSQTQDPVDPERVCAYMARALEALIDALETSPQTPSQAIDVLDEFERADLVRLWTGYASDGTAQEDPVDLFVERARDAPDAVALVADGATLSYGALDRRADVLAKRLADLGVGPDTLVGICLERSLDSIVAILGALKAGAAYLPLDPAQPPERLAYFIGDARPLIILSDPKFTDRLPPEAPQIFQNDDSGAQGEPIRGTLIRPAPDNLAYVIYTSGSTGKPKGVAISRSSLANLTRGQIRHHGFSKSDRLLQLASLSFDMSVEEIFPALCSGAALVLAPARFAECWEEFHALLHDNAVTFVNAPTSVWRDYANWIAANGKPLPQSIRAWAVGGEAPDIATLRLWRSLETTAIEWTNSYGPTETTVNAASYHLDESLTDMASVPIGRAVDNTQLYVLDRWLEPSPLGVAGEICIAGVQVGRGYLGRPDLTASAFLPDPYGPPGGRLYRTGDLGRYRADGVLDFLGRVDHQVKIRGHRIEPGEVEAALATHPKLRAAAVVAREAAPGVYRLVAYIVGDPAPDELRRHLQQTLPDYMIPAAFVALDALPLTANGKVDRKALPAPDFAATLAQRYVAPRNDVEEKLAKIWADVLRIPNVGVHDNFFELGGHSLLAMSLTEHLRRAGLSATIRDLFTHPTPEQLAKVLGYANDVDIPPNLVPPGCVAITPEMLPLVALTQDEINRVIAEVPGGASNTQDIYPLTSLQEGLLFHHLAASNGDPYLMPLVIAFDTREGLDAFMSALQAVIARHDILRTALSWEGLREPVQVVWRDASVVIEEVEIPDSDDPVQQLRARFDPRLIRLDIRKAPLVRAFAARDNRRNRWLLMLIIHHLVSDHAADDVLLTEIRAHLAGEADRLAPAVPYRNFVAQTRLGARAKDLETFFKNMLGDYCEPASPFGLLEDRGGAAIEETATNIQDVLAERLRRQARLFGVSMASLCHVAFARVLGRVSQRSDVVFGTVLFGRMNGGAKIDDAIGMFINTLPIRICANASSVASAIRDVHTLLSELVTYERASLALAQRCSGVAAPTPLFSALLNYRHSQPESNSDRDTILPGIEILFAEERTNYPLVLSVDDFGYGVRLTAQTRSISSSAVCAYMKTALESLVSALENAPETPFSELEVLPADERERLLSEWSGAFTPIRNEKTIVELFEERVANAPDADAVVFKELTLTYTQLNDNANALARRLASQGVGCETVVGVCLERSLHAIVALLAILKAGGAYLPLDPDYPAERLNLMIKDAAPLIIVTRKRFCEALPPTTNILDLDQGQASQEEFSSYVWPRARPQNIAYVTYTSGSTGRPKGVAVPHSAVVRLAMDERLREIGGTRETVLQHSPLAFDASTFEIWVPLLSGARIAVAPPDARPGGEDFGKALARHQVTTLWLTAALFHRIVDDRLGDVGSLKRLLVGGDAVSQRHANILLAAYPSMTLLNGYGPTENTTFSTIHPISASARAGVPIGRPIFNSTAYILDKEMNPTPVAAFGELYVGGQGLARGYIEHPDLTADRFVPNPFSDTGERLYRTGDLARFDESGAIEFLGRADRQVKIRGFRIEPGEVESALTDLSEIREAVVVPQEDAKGDKRLVAYVVINEGCDADIMDLRKSLEQTLPSFMLPSSIVTVDEFPTTPSGKLDRNALGKISDQPLSGSRYVAPRNAAEWLIAKEFSKVLDIESVGAEDNFFELGGHSLSAIRLVERIRRTLGRNLTPTTIFEAPTVALMAAFIREQTTQVSLCVELNAGGETTPLYCVHPAGGSVMRYRELAEALEGVIPVVGVQSRSMLDPTHVEKSIDEMASTYVAEIRSRHLSNAPYCLLGWSSGGVIAAAMAEKLEVQGQRVAFLGVLDSYADIGEDEFKGHTPLASFLELATLEGVDAEATLADADREELVEAGSGLSIREQYVFAAKWGVTHGYLGDASPELIDTICSDTETTIRLIRSHVLGRVSCPLHYWLADRPGSDALAPWQAIAGGGFNVRHIDSDHDGIVADPTLIGEVREKLGRIQDEWRGSGASSDTRARPMSLSSACSNAESNC